MNSGIASEFQKYKKFNILTHLKKKAKLNFYKTSADNSIPIIQKTVPGTYSLPHNQLKF